MIRLVVLSLALGPLAATAPAQDVFKQAMPAPPPDIGIVAVDPIDVGRVVVDAPYTAEAVTEVTQMLADGNRIEQRTSASIARDSRGRTRREQAGLAIGAFVASNQQPIVTITDPESGVHITLNHDLKVAFRSMPVKFKGNVRSSPSDAQFNVRLESAPIPFFDGSGPPSAVIASAPLAVAGAVAMGGGAEPGEPERLETKVIDGLAVEGFRRTTTIPAGAIGNLHPIEVVSERWYSPELQIVVMTRRFDPRFGETVYRVTNVQRGEPSPDLFKIPADFRIEEMRPGRMMPVRPDGQR